MKKPNKKEHLNLFFSAFLILAFIVCANFFANFSASMSAMAGQLVMIGVYAVFGLLLFYATRVGDGKAVFRFSPLTLLVLVVPAILIIVASLGTFMPLHRFVAPDKLTGSLNIVTILAAISLGYGLPYTFVSGFELATDEEQAQESVEETEPDLLEGGVEADLLDAEEQADAEQEELAVQDASFDAVDSEEE